MEDKKIEENVVEKDPNLKNVTPSNDEDEQFELQMQKVQRRQKVTKVSGMVFLYIIMTILALLALFPFIFMFLSSLMTNDQYRGIVEIGDMFPRAPLQWVNYQHALLAGGRSGPTFGVALFNTFIVAFGSTALSMIVIILSAYAFAKLKFAGKDLIFSLLLMTMMIPGELFTITNFITIHNMQLSDTLVALVLPFMISVYYIYLLRNNFKQIPDELYKAAKVDGLSDMKYLIKVMIPLTAPTITSITILKIIGIWNSYIWPQLINKNISYQLLSNWMAAAGHPATGDISEVQIPIKMAAATIITIPLLIAFLCFRKYIMRGISKSGIKG